MNWMKIVSMLASLAPFLAEYMDKLPENYGVIGSAIIGGAVAAKTIQDKRKKGAPVFSLKKAQDKVAKL